MKKRLISSIITTLSTIMLLTSFSINVYAFEAIPNEQEVVTTSISEGPEVSLFTEVRGYLYKIMDGKQYKRLWSYTYGRWVDPDWTLV